MGAIAVQYRNISIKFQILVFVIIQMIDDVHVLRSKKLHKPISDERPKDMKVEDREDLDHCSLLCVRLTLARIVAFNVLISHT